MSGVGYSSAYKGNIQISSLKHPEKYADNQPIVFRSKLEYDFMMEFDSNPIYLKWVSEPQYLAENMIYENPLKEGRTSRYFPDILVKMKTKKYEQGIINLLIEIKPQSELDAVGEIGKLKQNSKKFWRALQNIKKWDCAIAFCKAQEALTKEPWQFLVMTEKDLKNIRSSKS